MRTSWDISNMKSNPKQVSPNEDLDWAIGWNRVILQVLGLWIYPEQSRLRGVLSTVHTSLIVLSIFTFLILPQTMALIKIWGIPELIVDNITYNLPVSAAEFKLLILWYKKKDVAHLFTSIEKDWLTAKDIYERGMMMKYAKISKLVTIGGLVGSFATTSTYFIPITWRSVLRTINNTTDIPGALLPAQTVYVFDLTHSDTYRLTLISQYIGTVFASLSYTGVDVLFSMFVMHECGQLKILADRIETMASEKRNPTNSLKNNVKRHCSLIEYAEKTENIFSLLVLALVILFAIIFCLESFTLLTIFSDTANIPVVRVTFYILFAIYFLFLMFVYSWVGENLVTCSLSIHEAAYNCQWTLLTPVESAQITLILVRSQKPLYISAGKFSPMTLNTFVSICRTSCGWLSVLLATES